MKQILTLILFFTTLTFYSQNDINGIGRFKIGMDISIIDSLKTEGYKYRVYDRKKDILTTKSGAFLLRKDKRKDNPKLIDEDKVILEKVYAAGTENYGSAPMIEDRKCYIIQYYSVAGIDIDFMEINFYKGKLYKISISDNFDLITALGKKYKGVATNELGKKITCTNAYRSVEYQEESFKNTYRNDDKVTAYSMLSTYYYECEKRTLVYIIVSNRSTEGDVAKLESAAYTSLKSKKESEEKKSLDKL